VISWWTTVALDADELVWIREALALNAEAHTDDEDDPDRSIDWHRPAGRLAGGASGVET
jgi:hypothetical protein